MDEITRREVSLYIENANEALDVAQLNMDNDFYAANALLATKKLARSKHSGVLSAFRQHFIKTGLLASELSEIYEQVMDNCHEGDYEIITATSKEDAEVDVRQAREFVDTVSDWLKREKWL